MRDTNVLAAGFAGIAVEASLPGRLIRSWRAGRFELVVSAYILAELVIAWSDPYFRQRLRQEQVDGALELLRQEATVVPITSQVSGIAAHAEDDPILATAVSGQVDYLVTGDRQLLRLRAVQGVRIVSPRRFLAILDGAAGS